MAEAAGGEPRLPEEPLPSKPLLRCRTVCRSWRHILTSDAAFLLAHHRRQPALQLHTIWDDRECRIDALDHCAGERHPVARTDLAASSEKLHLLAACDGLLVVSAYRVLHICNPATRQRAPLPLLRGVLISGLYPHRPSGPYRVLCCSRSKVPDDDENDHAVYYVYTVGSDKIRCIGEAPEQWATGNILPLSEFCYPHALVQGRLHWRPVELPGSSKCNNMLVFDTVAESFRHVRTPVEGPCADLFEMKGKLELYSYNGYQTAELWVLENYEDNVWSFKYRIKLDRRTLFLVPDAQGDVYLTCLTKGSVVGMSQHYLKHLSGGVATQHEWSNCLSLTRHRFKESLVQHDFFPADGNGGVDETPLFHGLSTAVVLPDDDNSELD